MEGTLVKPLVSVVIPFYSHKKWLIEAIESVITQTYKNYEILVVNDGSPEDISDVEKKYSNIVNFIYQENGGPSKARNTGIEKSCGKYIAFLDSDDIWLEDKLKNQVFQMESNNSKWSQHSYEMFWEESNKKRIEITEIHQGNVYKDCFISFKVQTSTVVVRRDVLIENKIRFPLDKRFGQDLAFYKDIAKLYSLDYIEGCYSRFRIRGNNAGFRAEVQLANRAMVWEDIQESEDIQRILPRRIILAYRLAHTNYRIYRAITKSVDNSKVLEWISGILYINPYVIFKSYNFLK